MLVRFSELNPTKAYHLMMQTITPRPIAWVLTANEAHDDKALDYNLAPFSYFAPVCSNPPTLIVSLSQKPSGEEKDTYVNILREKGCVVHIASVENLAALNQSSATLDYGDSEITQGELSLSAVEGQALPRLTDAPVAYYCTLQQVVDLPPDQQHVVFLEIQEVWLNDDIVTTEPRLAVNAQALNPLSRLGGGHYGSLGELFDMARPK